jgi:CRP/FNR family transcriptional regulator, cyclic AMP receptor protein
MDPKLDLLRKVPLFAQCRTRSIEEIGRLADEVDVPAGKVLARQGEQGDAFYLLASGSAQVERDGTVLGTLGPGDFFGEIALIDHGPRTATVTTSEPSRVLVVGHREFESLLDEFPALRADILAALAARVRALEPNGAA